MLTQGTYFYWYFTTKIAGNDTNEFLAAYTAKVSTLVVASAPQYGQCLHSRFPAPFANSPGRRKVNGNRLTKLVFNGQHNYPPGSYPQNLIESRDFMYEGLLTPVSLLEAIPAYSARKCSHRVASSVLKRLVCAILYTEE